MDQPASTKTAAGSDRDRRARDPLELRGRPAAVPRDSVLATLVRDAALGIALLDADRRWLYVNTAGCRIMGAGLDDLVGREAPFVPADTAGPGEPVYPGDVRSRYVDVAVGDRGRRALAYVENGFVDGQGWRTAVMFRDVTDARQHQRQLAAFARTASSLSYARSLQQVLDRVAADALAPTGAVACAIVLIDPHTHAFRMAGTAGLPEDFLGSIERSRQRGAPMATLEAFEARRPAIRRDVQRMLEDPRYEPLHESIAEAAWTSVVAVPLVARDHGLGVLDAFYPAGHDPTEEDTAFLGVMADQVAVAVDNAQLLGDLEGKAALEERHRLARELHDSVSQALFSMSLHARAVQMAAQQSGVDPDAPVARGVAQLLELTQGALAEMRALIFQLRPEALHEEGLSAAVRKHAAAVAAREGFDVRVHTEDDRLSLDEVAEEELFRVVQEALHNCVKHAQPEHVVIRLVQAAADPGTLVVEIDDDGVGFEPSAPHPGHLGMDSMRERTERLGGRLVVESSSAGSRVRAVLPAVLHLEPPPGPTYDADSDAASVRP
ncbi:GAF domain-containing protein [Nocardioides immobilis]|uniref:GAF domain-containing protein n=1 Tax=Nocardioides immobilis TaxID=2049295 RepID=A0A417Y940_9ACTN|nr:histidine kinase [Nocardioides immobilis]RHW29105.1 GAF domain-containing protein [Nocardioides immobilis]